MNEKLFYRMNIIGIICGLTGLLASIGWPDVILLNHYFELILLPPLILYVYFGIITKVQKRNDVYDERQNYHMTRAAAISLPYSIGAMFLLYAMYKRKHLLWSGSQFIFSSH